MENWAVLKCGIFAFYIHNLMSERDFINPEKAAAFHTKKEAGNHHCQDPKKDPQKIP